MTAAIYARVSTEDQHCSMQLTELRGFAKRMGWKSVDYIETASSVKKRPVFERLLADARLRKIDIVLVWKIDRLARSMKQFVDTLMDLESFGVRFIAPTQGIDTDKQNPTSKFLMQILAAFAELERNMIVERVEAGVKEYQRDYAAGRIGRERHSKSGKDLAVGRPRRIFRRDEALRLRRAGMSWRAIGKRMGVPQSTIRLAINGLQVMGNVIGKRMGAPQSTIDLAMQAVSNARRPGARQGTARRSAGKAKA